MTPFKGFSTFTGLPRTVTNGTGNPGHEPQSTRLDVDYYLREETYQKALSEIVNFHHRFPFSSYWGEGKTASADGQHFPIYSRKGHTAATNTRYGTFPSALFYTHISDQYAPFYTQPITATARDATYVIDGLLYHQTDLTIEEIYTDTAGFTDHVFALCHLLGTRFAPRIRDLPDKKLYTLESPATYQALTAIIGSKSKVRLMERNWDTLLRLACSIQSGVTTASLLIRKIAAQHTNLSIALGSLAASSALCLSLITLSIPNSACRSLWDSTKARREMRLPKPSFSTAGESFWIGRGSSNPTAPVD